MSVISKVLLVLFVLLGNQLVNAAGKYTSRLEYSFKAGNLRSISRPSYILPIVQDSTMVTYAVAIAMIDSKENIEGNFGLGFRKIINGNIIGLYGFYDHRSVPFEKNDVHDYGSYSYTSSYTGYKYVSQATIGFEYFTKFIDYRANVYLPIETENDIPKKYSEVKITKSSTHLFKHNVRGADVTETFTALRWFDLDVGLNFQTEYPIYVRGAYYQFGTGQIDDVIHEARGTTSVVLGKNF